MTHFVRKTLWALLAAGTVAVLSVAAIPAPFALAPDVPGGNVEGTIIVKKKLTKPRVTSSVDEYGRSAVELGADAPQDPLSYERSHVVVYLDGAGLPSRAVSASMEQKNRRFSPDLLVIPQGSTVSFPNLDSIFHNVFSLSKPKSFDLGNYPMNQTRLVTFPKAGVVFVNCHLHPNMAAAIVVTPNRWSTRAAESGHFSLPGVPAGKYTIVAWHKSAGFFRQEIQVGEKGKSGIEFLIPIDEDAMGKGRDK